MAVYIFLSVALVSLVSLVGAAALALRPKILESVSSLLVGLAAGGLFGDALVHLLPEAFERLENPLGVSLGTLAGLLGFFSLEKFIRWRHCHRPITAGHPHPVVMMNLVGDGIHNLIDGVLIGASYLVSLPLGVTTTLAVLLHEIPQEIGDFGVLVHGGLSVKKSLWLNFASALAAILGAGLALVIGSQLADSIAYLLPVTAGGFLYIAGADLVPELHHETKASTSLLQFLAILVGAGLMVVLR